MLTPWTMTRADRAADLSTGHRGGAAGVAWLLCPLCRAICGLQTLRACMQTVLSYGALFMAHGLSRGYCMKGKCRCGHCACATPSGVMT